MGTLCYVRKWWGKFKLKIVHCFLFALFYIRLAHYTVKWDLTTVKLLPFCINSLRFGNTYMRRWTLWLKHWLTCCLLPVWRQGINPTSAAFINFVHIKCDLNGRQTYYTENPPRHPLWNCSHAYATEIPNWEVNISSWNSWVAYSSINSAQRQHMLISWWWIKHPTW